SRRRRQAPHSQVPRLSSRRQCDVHESSDIWIAQIIHSIECNRFARGRPRPQCPGFCWRNHLSGKEQMTKTIFRVSVFVLVFSWLTSTSFAQGGFSYIF